MTQGDLGIAVAGNAEGLQMAEALTGVMVHVLDAFEDGGARLAVVLAITHHDLRLRFNERLRRELFARFILERKTTRGRLVVGFESPAVSHIICGLTVVI